MSAALTDICGSAVFSITSKFSRLQYPQALCLSQSFPMPTRSCRGIPTIFFRKPPLDATLPAPLLFPLLDHELLLRVNPQQSTHYSVFCSCAAGQGVV